MNGPLSVWAQLVEDIRKARVSPAHSRTEVQNALVRRFKRLADQKRCSGTAIGWLENQSTKQGRNLLGLMVRADGRDGRDRPAIKLKNLAHLEDGALLTISVEIDDRRREILSYSIALHGALRGDGAAWYARLDLDESCRGQGPCAHALLHAHIGLGDEAKFSPRAPLPWLHPADALDWLLATVEPAMEPPQAGP
jgi:hypothetical protein